jgi:N-acetylglucosaminyldiphosphoundecaprenol N-acetyl-beta-D-mannosaminyltransferase
MSISMVNVAKVMTMQKDPLLRDSVESGDLILADGMPLVWLSRLTPNPLPERVTGIDLMFQLFSLADQQGLRVFLLGAKAETLERVIEIARERYPRMVIAGFRDGFFTDQEQEAVACSVRDARPDILLVAMSSPKKELFMRQWGEYMNVPICHGVGGSFDVMAGVTKRAPAWMQRCGLEWSYRLAQEPRRMWKRYLTTNLAFLRQAPRCALCRRDRSDCDLRWAGNGRIGAADTEVARSSS